MIQRRPHIGTLSYTRTALVVFFVIASSICICAAFTVLLPGTPLSSIWAIKPDVFVTLNELRPWSGISFLALSVLMGVAAWGCWLGRLWAWRLAIAIFVANGFGDLVQIFNGRVFEGALGSTVVLALVFWLTRPRVKAAFR